MFKVTFQGPIIVGDAALLAELLASTSTAALVEPMVASTTPVVDNPTPQVQETNPAPAARRGRKPKPEEPATAQTGTAGDAGQAESNAAAGELNPGAADSGKGDSKGDKPPAVDGDLLDRFTGLVDRDYDAALQLLEQFGVARFSDLKEDQQAAFGDALTQLQA